MPSTPPLTAPRSTMRRWRRRKDLWDRTYGLLFRAIKTEELPAPNDIRVEVTTWAEAHGQAVPGLKIGAPTPEDEYSDAKAVVRKGIVKLRGAFPQLMKGLPQVSDEPARMLKQIWAKPHERSFGQEPKLPAAFKQGLELGKLALAGPFTSYVTCEDDGSCVIDLTHFQKYDHQAGLRNLATRTRFQRVGRKLKAVEIECPVEGERYTPEDEGWNEAQRLVACGLFTDATVVRHLGYCHLFVSGPFAVACRNALPADHPLKALLWPHVHGGLDVNNTLGPALIDARPGEGVFGDIFNLTPEAIWALMGDHAAAFSLARMSPVLDRAARGLAGEDGLDTPTHDDAIALWEIISAYTTEYVNCTWESDEGLAADTGVCAFLTQLNELVPNGVGEVVAPEAPTREGLARLVALLIQTAAVEHEVVGNLTWNFGTWAMYVPTRVYEGGGLPPRDRYQRFFNVLFATNVPARKLMEDTRHIAPTRAHATAMRNFQASLKARQEEMVKELGSKRLTRLYPKDLEACVAV